jgi:Ca2+-transporting ATPase
MTVKLHPSPPPVPRPWSETPDSVWQALGSNPEHGLSRADVEERLKEHGPNLLRSHARRGAWTIWFDQFRSVLVALLMAAGIAAWLFNETIEAIAVAVVVLVNAMIGFATESRAVRSMEALRRLGNVTARVVRDRQVVEVAAESLVPGDLVELEGGDVVSADLRILTASNLQADESTLTGESLAVDKTPNAVAEDAIIADRTSMLFKGTSVTKGSALCVVVATGMNTELGRISDLVEQSDEPRTPLEQRLDVLGHMLLKLTVVVAFLSALAGVLRGQDLVLMVEMGIALAVAAVPEGLPVVATIALASGLREMARRNALINRLSSVETLGATSVILTDKTGTLTMNRMEVVRLITADADLTVTGDGTWMDSAGSSRDDIPASVADLVDAGVLCNRAHLKGEGSIGDPTEVALLLLGRRFGREQGLVSETFPEVREDAFDPRTKMMATWHRLADGFLVAVKGAPDRVIPLTSDVWDGRNEKPLLDEDRSWWLDRNEALAVEGLRVLALARRTAPTPDGPSYHRLALLGLVGLLDPPRADAGQAVAACQAAGIEVVMVTGDQVPTARAVASTLGLPTEPALDGSGFTEGMDSAELSAYRLFARVSPEQKLQVLRAYQSSGHIVAMTGDGVNDAPALKAADIGVAMGLRGTQVAKEAADMILEDDSFPTIVAAIERGRIIFGNIRRFLVFLLSCNLSEVLVVGLATAIGASLPILPLQLLFLNFVTDVFPALALGVGKGEPGAMQAPPRPMEEQILGRPQWKRIVLFGLLITAACLAAFILSLRWLSVPSETAVTVSFLTLAFAQLWNVLNMREEGSHAWKNDVLGNPWVRKALLLCSALILVAVYVPWLATALSLQVPGLREWMLIGGCSLFPLLIGQSLIAWRGRSSAR